MAKKAAGVRRLIEADKGPNISEWLFARTNLNCVNWSKFFCTRPGGASYLCLSMER